MSKALDGCRLQCAIGFILWVLSRNQNVTAVYPCVSTCAHNEMMTFLGANVLLQLGSALMQNVLLLLTHMIRLSQCLGSAFMALRFNLSLH